MRRVRRSRQPEPDRITRAWVAGHAPPAGADRETLVGIIFFGEHPPTSWRGNHHPMLREWLDALGAAHEPPAV